MSSAHEDNSRGGDGVPGTPGTKEENAPLSHADKKETHKIFEKKRKDETNQWIAKIGELLPEKPRKRNKNTILEKSVEYISELKECNQKLLLEQCSEVQAQEVLKLQKHIRALEEKNSFYLSLLQKAGIPTEESWEDNVYRCPKRPTLEQASALLKRLENGTLPNGLSKSKKTLVSQQQPSHQRSPSRQSTSLPNQQGVKTSQSQVQSTQHQSQPTQHQVQSAPQTQKQTQNASQQPQSVAHPPAATLQGQNAQHQGQCMQQVPNAQQQAKLMPQQQVQTLQQVQNSQQQVHNAQSNQQMPAIAHQQSHPSQMHVHPSQQQSPMQPHSGHMQHLHSQQPSPVHAIQPHPGQLHPSQQPSPVQAMQHSGQLQSLKPQQTLITKNVDATHRTLESVDVVASSLLSSSMHIEPAESISVISSIAAAAATGGSATVMTQALPQLPVMSTNQAAPPSIQMGGGTPSLIVINDNGIPILHNVVTFQNSPIILNSASSSPMLASATPANFPEPCGAAKDMGTPQRIASAPSSVPVTGPSAEVIIRPQSADTTMMKQVPAGSSSSTITFSSTPILPQHLLPAAPGGMIGFNQQQNSLYSGPPAAVQSLPTALILPNGQIIPVVSQPSLMYPTNLTWTNKIASPQPQTQIVKTHSNILPSSRPPLAAAAPLSHGDSAHKTMSKKVVVQKKNLQPITSESMLSTTISNSLPENDKFTKLVASNSSESDINKNKVPLRNIKSMSAPKKNNTKPQPPAKVTPPSSQANPTTLNSEANKEMTQTLSEPLPPPLIEPELPTTTSIRPTTDILAQATESIFSSNELSPPTLTQETNLECQNKEKDDISNKEPMDNEGEKSQDILSSITASVFTGAISSDELIYTANSIVSTHSTSDPQSSVVTTKENSEINSNKRFRTYSSESPTQGKRPKGNDVKDGSPSQNISSSSSIVPTNTSTANSLISLANNPLEKSVNQDKSHKCQTLTNNTSTQSKQTPCPSTSSLSVTSLLSSQKDFNNSIEKLASPEVMTSSSLMLSSNTNDNYMSNRDEHELPSLMLSSLTEDPSSLESGSNSGLPFLALSPSEHFTSDISGKDLASSAHNPFNFGSPHGCEGLTMSQKEKSMENLEINPKKKENVVTSISTHLYSNNSFSHAVTSQMSTEASSNLLQQFSPATSTSPQMSLYQTSNQTQPYPSPIQRSNSVDDPAKSPRISHPKPPHSSVPSPSMNNQTLCYSSSPLSRHTPRHTPDHVVSESSQCYSTAQQQQNFAQMKSPRSQQQLKPNSPAAAQNIALTQQQSMDKGHHQGGGNLDSPFISSSRSLEGSPSLSSYSAEALLSHQPNTTVSTAKATSCSQPLTTYPSNFSPRGTAARPSISYSAESLIQTQSCLDKKQQAFTYRPTGSYNTSLPDEVRSQHCTLAAHSFVDSHQMGAGTTPSYTTFCMTPRQPAPPPINTHSFATSQDQCRPSQFNRPSCTFPPSSSSQPYSNLSISFSNAQTNNARQQHRPLSSATSCLQNFAPMSEPTHHQNGCLFPNQTPHHHAASFSENLPPLLHNTNTFSNSSKYEANKSPMISSTFPQPPPQNHIMNNFFHSNYVTPHRHDIPHAPGKPDHHAQAQSPSLNKVPSPTKASKSNSKKSKQNNTENANVPHLPFDNSRNNSPSISYFQVPDLSSSRADTFGNPRYFSPAQRPPLVSNMLNDHHQAGRMAPPPPRPPPPPTDTSSYNQLFKPQTDPTLKFQSTGFGMPPSGSGQSHVPNFNLSNIFPDITPNDPTTLGFSAMKFHPPPLTSQPQPMETPHSATAAPSRGGATTYHPTRPPNLLAPPNPLHAPPAPFSHHPSHTPSFGNMIPFPPLHEHSSL